MKLFAIAIALLVGTAAAVSGPESKVSGPEPKAIGEACAAKNAICHALQECKDAAGDKANWGSNKCDNLEEGPCKVFCAKRVAEVNAGKPKACKPFKRSDDFDGDCKAFLAARQTGEKGEKQVRMMKYCQVKEAKAKEDAAKAGRAAEIKNTVKEGNVASKKGIFEQKTSFKALRGQVTGGKCGDGSVAECVGKSKGTVVPKGCCNNSGGTACGLFDKGSQYCNNHRFKALMAAGGKCGDGSVAECVGKSKGTVVPNGCCNNSGGTACGLFAKGSQFCGNHH